MAYILGLTNSSLEIGALRQRWQDYRQYLESVRDRLPSSTYEFAIADWRHPEYHRALHDSWVEHVIIRELFSGERKEGRSIEIEVQLLGPYHDGHTTLKYIDVKSYSLDAPKESKHPPYGVGHGDWLQDEVRLSDAGLVLHEVEFSRGSRWLIECMDIEWRWET